MMVDTYKTHSAAESKTTETLLAAAVGKIFSELSFIQQSGVLKRTLVLL